MKPRISVVVCTRNRLPALRHCLESLSRLQGSAGLELLVVDNASRDGTARFLRDWAATAPGPEIRALTEPVQGLSRARNRALEVARGEWVAFLDDDATVPGDYGEELLAVLDRADPGIDLLAIPVRDLLPGTWPIWMPPDFLDRPRLEAGEFDLAAHPGAVCSCGLLVRRRLIQEAGGFDPELGMQGRRIGVGEETQLIQKLADRGIRALWSERPEVLHHLDEGRGRRRYWWRRGLASGRYSAPAFWAEVERQGLARSAVGETRVVLSIGVRVLLGALTGRMDSAQRFLAVRRQCKHAGRLMALPAVWRQRGGSR